MAKRNLISINEAAARGIERVRHPNWENKFDHVKIDIFDGKPGPWLHLYAPFNKWCNGRDPVDFLCIGSTVVDLMAKGMEIYSGPLSTSDEYQAAVASFAPRMKQLMDEI